MYLRGRKIRPLAFTAAVTIFLLVGWRIALAFIALGETTGTSAGDLYGASVACLDNTVAVGAPGAQSDSGAAYSVDGRSNVVTPLLTPAPLNTPFTPAQFGNSVAVSDLNLDGQPDILVGAPGYFLGGGVFAYTNTANPPSASFISNQTNEAFGFTVAEVPGANDGSPGFAASAPLAAGGGRVDFFAPFAPTPIAQITPPGGDNASQFGIALTAIGDLNSDGVSEVAVSAVRASTVSTRSVYIYTGDGSTLLARLDDTSGRTFGNSIASIGDANGDGIPDLLIGAPSSTTTIPGHAYLYSGASLAGGGPVLLCDITAPQLNDGFGTAVAGTGEGAANSRIFIISAPHDSSDTGAVYQYLYNGSTCIPFDKFLGSTSGYNLGVSLAGRPSAGACDFDGDGRSDIAVGTESDANGTDTGSVRLLALLTPTPTPTATPTATPSPTITPSPTPTRPPPPEPRSSRLTFRLDNSGNLSLRVTYDAQPDAVCSFTLYARRTVRSARGRVTQIFSGPANSPSLQFSVGGLPKVAIENNAVPVINMIVVTQCGTSISRTVQSNVYARYLNCGRGRGVSSDSWVSIFRKKFRRKYS